MAFTKTVFIFLTIQSINKGFGERTKDQMYDNIDGSSGCYRRLNATHQIGCSSKRGGSTGVIHVCETLDDLNHILYNGTAPPYIPVMPARLFTMKIVQKLINSKKVSGLVLHLSNDTIKSLDHFSHEYQCPNPLSSIADTCSSKGSIWNPYGTGLLYADIPFPIFYLENEDEVMKIKKCFEKFNNFSYNTQVDRSLCSLELKAFMYATTNTQTCRRRSNIASNMNPMKFCDPLGDSNIWASLHPLVEGSKSNETKPIRDTSYIVVAARMDTTSMFDRTSGANSPVTGIVTLLTVAKYLKQILGVNETREGKRNILFMLFNGETYDYIGSQRMLYDMLRGDFPIRGVSEANDILPIIHPENISLYIELSQMGNTNNDLFVHYLVDNEEINEFYNKLQTNSRVVKFQNVSTSLPPASLHTFLKNISTFPGLIISDHKSSYTNHFYNSIFDNSTNIQYQYYNASDDDSQQIPNDSLQYFIANVSEIIGNSIFEEITKKKYDGNGTVDVTLVDELLHCYLEDPNCKVHQALRKGGKFSNGPLNLYVGVDHVINYATTVTALTLGWFTGDIVGDGNVNCTNHPRNYAFKFYNMSKSIQQLNTTKCYKITMNTTEAISPAFLIPDYDWSSGEFSSWTESTWAEMNVRMFLKPSAAHEKMTIAIGCISMIFSFVIVYFVKSRSLILFTPLSATESPTNC
ncbi:nicastrin [Leptinotarsa decemlineata]|uniref:nicastrin n=1 Tax=Leptinotarsa decemlineata TaxID=7539 RepID=UPI003D30CA62